MAPELVKFRGRNKRREGSRVSARSSESSLSLAAGCRWMRSGWLLALAALNGKRRWSQWMHLQDPEAQVGCVLKEAMRGAESPASTSTEQKG